MIPAVKLEIMKNKQLKEWLMESDYYHILPSRGGNIIKALEYWPFSMQWGVYLGFFDSVGMYVSVRHKAIRLDVLKYEAVVNSDFQEYYNTRQEAQQEAIKKAFEILGKND